MLEQAAILRQGGHLNELWCRVVVMSVIGGHLISEFSTRNALSPYPLSQNMPTPTKAVARLQGRAGAANLEDLDQVIANYLLVALTRIAHSLDTGTRPLDHDLLIEYARYTDTIHHIVEGSEFRQIAESWTP